MSPDFTLGNLYGLLGVIFIYFRNNSYISSFQHHLLGVGERFILCLVLGFLKFEHSASRGKGKRVELHSMSWYNIPNLVVNV